jgi:hypothetical protein
MIGYNKNPIILATNVRKSINMGKGDTEDYIAIFMPYYYTTNRSK